MRLKMGMYPDVVADDGVVRQRGNDAGVAVGPQRAGEAEVAGELDAVDELDYEGEPPRRKGRYGEKARAREGT